MQFKNNFKGKFSDIAIETRFPQRKSYISGHRGWGQSKNPQFLHERCQFILKSSFEGFPNLKSPKNLPIQIPFKDFILKIVYYIHI